MSRSQPGEHCLELPFSKCTPAVCVLQAAVSGGSHLFNGHTPCLFSPVRIILYLVLTSCNAKWHFCKARSRNRSSAFFQRPGIHIKCCT